MMPLCGRSGLDSCPSVTGLEAAGRERRRVGFAPAKSKRKPLPPPPPSPPPSPPPAPTRHRRSTFYTCAFKTHRLRSRVQSLGPEWRNGRRTRLKIWRPHGHMGSSPFSGTIPDAIASLRRGARVDDWARLESACTPKGCRGFESLPLRHPPACSCPRRAQRLFRSGSGFRKNPKTCQRKSRKRRKRFANAKTEKTIPFCSCARRA